ncbi:MAG TPA: hypothetical protein VMT95_01925 [Candidatus Binatia bacterium]|nr:hypothetical protein [Candidatus Binatia bacterium]
MSIERHGIGGSRAELVWDAIAWHDQSDIAHSKAPKMVLANAGVAADFGAYLKLMKREDMIGALTTPSRTGFVSVFLDAVAVLAKREPQAIGNCFVTDVGHRTVTGFHFKNFCDAVQDDPFAGY